ncbi:DUF302 domain-containing protein [Salegentibacter chungangensis]|uniref:DUF302 domain-containing protein n=1 Tax=Salegentibacter chungangensis TaxID=1335724 RepID=A0ABW3NPQ3_9FLAO
MNVLALLFSLCLFCIPGEYKADCMPAGSKLVKSDNGFEETYSKIISQLKSAEGVKIISEIDHAQNAKQVGLELSFSRLIIFGNPELGSPAMQERQLLGLDLPHKILVFKSEEGEVFVLYNSMEYLKTRYNLKRRKELRQMCRFLEESVKLATNSRPKRGNASEVYGIRGVVIRSSAKDYNTTYNNLRNAILKKDGFQIMAEVNHQENAVAAEIGLRDSGLIIFGNPLGGTKLMQEDICIGLDLPMKILVWEDEDGIVKISYNRPEFLQKRYGLEDHPVLDKMSKLFSGLVKESLSE